MINRLILLVVLFLVIFLIIRLYQRKKRQADLEKNQAISKTKHVTIRKCRYCGLHIPEHEATVHRGEHFCSLEHAQRYKPTDSP
ncbi:MAG: PP0621 family protein [bacterium]